MIALLSVCSLTALAEDFSLRKLLVEMPDSVIPYLTRNNRLDFIDFIDSGMTAKVTNSLGGSTTASVLTDDTVCIRLNDACMVSMMLLSTQLPVDSCNRVIAVVRTIGFSNAAREVEIDFYTVHWRHLAEKPDLVAMDEQRLYGRETCNSLPELMQNIFNNN